MVTLPWASSVQSTHPMPFRHAHVGVGAHAAGAFTQECIEQPSPRGSLKTQIWPFWQLSHVQANSLALGAGGGGWHNVTSHCGKYEHLTLLQ